MCTLRCLLSTPPAQAAKLAPILACGPLQPHACVAAGLNGQYLKRVSSQGDPGAWSTRLVELTNVCWLQLDVHWPGEDLSPASPTKQPVNQAVAHVHLPTQLLPVHQRSGLIPRFVRLPDCTAVVLQA